MADEIVEQVEILPKKTRKTKDTVTMVVLRDYWTKGDGSPDDRVVAGAKVELSIDDAMKALEIGAMRRATETD